MSWLGTSSRHRKRSNTGAPSPTTGEVKFFEKTKVSPGSEFSLHFMKMALPSRLKGAPSELAASAEVLLGSLFPTFCPPQASLPATRRRSRAKAEAGSGAASLPEGRRSSSAPASIPRDKSPRG